MHRVFFGNDYHADHIMLYNVKLDFKQECEIRFKKALNTA